MDININAFSGEVNFDAVDRLFFGLKNSSRMAPHRTQRKVSPFRSRHLKIRGKKNPEGSKRLCLAIKHVLGFLFFFQAANKAERR